MCSDECYTVDGHLVGMLDRDLRTAKTHQKDEHDRIQCHNTCGFARRRFQSKTSERWCRKLSHHIRKSLQKFKQAAVVLLCFLYVVKIPFAATYPTQATMSDGQEHDSNQVQRQRLVNINEQARITMKQVNNAFNSDFLNSSSSIPNVEGLADERVHFLFEETNRLYSFPNISTFDSNVVGAKIVETASMDEFLLTFADCLSRFDSAFKLLKDKDAIVVYYGELLWTEISDYLRGGTQQPTKTQYTLEDFKNELTIPENDHGLLWKKRVLVHRDFALTTRYFSQAMEYLYLEYSK